MIINAVICCHCGSPDLIRYGHASNGKQRYWCKACQKQSRKNPSPHAYAEERKEEILRAFEERSSLRGIEQTFHVSRASVIAWIKKSDPASSLE